MRKILLVGLVSFSLSASLAEARFFIGLETGYEFNGKPTFVNSTKEMVFGSSVLTSGIGRDAWTIGYSLGTEHIWGFVGLRWFLGVNYSLGVLDKSQGLQVLETQLGIDTIFNFTDSDSFAMGMFVGIAGNINMMTLTGKLLQFDYMGSGAIGRLGFTFKFGSHNRLDITSSIPILQVAPFIDENLKKGGIYDPIRLTIGYKVVI